MVVDDVDIKQKMKIRLKLETLIYTKMEDDVAGKSKTPGRFAIFAV